MSSLFGILSVAGQSLLTFQRGINSTNKNIANVSTEGYNREIPVFQDLPRSGVFMNKIIRVFDQSLFSRSIDLNQKLNSDNEFASGLSNIETIFNDALGTGFSSDLNTFFNSINDMLIKPDDLAARSQFLANAQTLVGKIRNTDKTLEDLKQQTVLKVRDQINQINQITSQLAKLNQNIKTKTLDIEVNNEYLNERDRLIKQLSDLIDTKVVFNEDNTVNVFTAKGYGLVVGFESTQLSFETDSNGNAVVKWNNVADITKEIQNGQVGGNLKTIDKVNEQLNKLNDFVTVLTTVFNKVHRQGYGLDGSTNTDFFKIDPSKSGTKIDASNVYINITDPKKVALASDPNYLNSDNTNGKNLLGLKNNISNLYTDPAQPVLTPTEESNLKASLNDPTNYDFIKTHTFAEFYNTKLVAEVSSTSSYIKQQQQNNKYLYDTITEKMKSITGVNMDEELINLTKLQRSYEASARIITVTDELMQTILGLIK
ncbi:MAG: flagellar hook-associated protein FlgK [Sulfurihydrogenibium sp.]